ncbi:MAG: hypothetical protein BAJATHORv1_60054 [Candidatus Thorarchaeota archaeon]|nr:MAG: hypothetical protein BAJATHORv1_60054 [Candidatus Thorarchaeota archaeon]
MTFSIVAVDIESKEIGFAIASCTWDAGMVGTAKAEKGALCSQAQGYFPFHSVLYEKIDEGMNLEQIFEEFKKIDENIENRQVGMVSFSGEVFAFTGSENDEYAGHIIGDSYACQGNILTGPEVLEHMSQTFESSDGMLAEKLYAALQAGDDVGGDIRGKMSARVLVKKKNGSDLEDTYIDLRVEDHDEPVKEIGRLLAVRKKIFNAYLAMRKVMETGERDKIVALEEMQEYLSDKVDRTVIDYHSFLADEFLQMGLEEEAINSYQDVLTIAPKLIRSLKKQVKSGHIPKSIFEKIVE